MRNGDFPRRGLGHGTNKVERVAAWGVLKHDLCTIGSLPLIVAFSCLFDWFTLLVFRSVLFSASLFFWTDCLKSASQFLLNLAKNNKLACPFGLSLNTKSDPAKSHQGCCLQPRLQIKVMHWFWWMADFTDYPRPPMLEPRLSVCLSVWSRYGWSEAMPAHMQCNHQLCRIHTSPATPWCRSRLDTWCRWSNSFT